MSKQEKKRPMAKFPASHAPAGNIKTVIADRMHEVAGAMGERAASQDHKSAMAQYGKQEAELLV